MTWGDMSWGDTLRQTGASPLNPGAPDRTGPYMPLGLLGSGGMGRVYLARPTDDSPGLAAVKVIRPEYAEDAQFRRRFQREAAVQARVSTARAPRLRGTGFQDELLWMATEYIPGLNLAEAVRLHGSLRPIGVWRLVADLGHALLDLASAGIVHRDLKPSNVILSVQGAHVIDFGISRAADVSAITTTGNRVGTPAFMSPEHLRDGRCDTLSDVFSLAGTLVYAATGHAPFGDGTGVDVMHRVAFEEPNEDVIGELSAADPELGALLSACLAKEPARRPGPRELIDAARTRLYGDGWQEPLNSQLLGRQRAYEALHRLPAEQTVRFRPAAPLRTPTAPAVQSAPAAPAGFSPPGPPGLPEGRRKGGRKVLFAVAAGVVVCVVAASATLLTRQDSATSSGSSTVSAAAAPDDVAVSVLPPGTSGEASPSSSGGAEERTKGGTSTSVEPSAPDNNGPSRPGSKAPPTSPPTTPSGSPPSSPTAQPTPPPPWISDCTYYSGRRLTRYGNKGRRVVQVQCMLTKRGYSIGNAGVDGNFGKATRAAVRQFQGDRGLDVDGIVGPRTWGALRNRT
jgi:serine/threonine protein kinase